MNDVSILFPLPTAGALDALLAPSSSGAFGELLPLAVFERAPELAPGADELDTYGRLRVVSARIDPCFPSLVQAPSPSCRFQVRLVLQPLLDDGVSVQAEEAALHLFYDLPAEAFIALIQRLDAARRPSAPVAPLAALEVHPTLVAEGSSGPYRTRLREALLQAIGRERLTRMTFMARGAGNGLRFGGFDLAEGEARPVSIVDSAVTEQTFENDSLADPLSFSASVTPALALAAEDLSPLYDSAAAAGLGDAALWSLYQAALRVENPTHHSPADVDCVTCHTAQPARLWIERNSALGERSSPFRYASSFDLSVRHAVAETTRAPVAFGWVGDRPAISARTVNDSAAVASYLNDRLGR